MHMMLYRGSLKSCNYSCSYCPFSKHGMTEKELAKDREQWFLFLHNYMERAQNQDVHALMLAPYGEALIHPWYWEGLAYISVFPWMEAVGAQTNLGFSVPGSLDIFRENKGMLGKLRLWATFHPGMTTVEEFAKSCRQLTEAGVKISAGAVGVPAHMELLLRLRKELPEETYLWINRMDGLGRAYTAKEKQMFSDIDPYFYRELQLHPADASQCRERLFAQGDGKLRMCNISAVLDAGWIESFPYGIKAQNSAWTCSRKQCACYLAYGGRKNLVNQMLFGPWPLFRIPRRPKAVFLDIEGTLLPNQCTERRHLMGRTGRPECRDIPADVQEALEVLVKREGTLLFFATTLPYADARKRCGSVWHLFSGGVFSAGAHILFNCTKNRNRKDETARQAAGKEFFLNLDEKVVEHLGAFQQRLHFRMLVYRNKEGGCYKITLLHAHRNIWDRQGAEKVMECLSEPFRSRVRYLTEGHCMQIIAARAGKAAGVQMLCSWLQIPLEEVFAAGDSREDAKMVELCG